MEAGTLVEALVPGVCPLCGASPEHHNLKAECDGNVSLVVTAATAERKKIVRLRRELADTVHQLRAEAGSFDRFMPSMQKQLETLDGQLELLLPDLSERRTSYTDFIQKRAQIQGGLAVFEQIADLEHRREVLEDSPTESPEEGANVTDLPSTVLDKFSKEIESILQAWQFPDASRVHFEQSNRDLVITGKQRGSRGKGMRAITHAAFTIGLMEFCRKAGASSPWFCRARLTASRLSRA